MKTLYVHIPFCRKKCFYCSFVVSVGQIKKIDLYLEGLGREAQKYKGEEVQSIYIGGGTPTLMNNDQLKKLFNIVRENFRIMPDAEWTIEANPDGISRSKLKLIKEEGINRVSLGVQSLNNKYLEYLGRNHDPMMALKAYGQLREVGFNNINIDLMFGYSDQNADELREDINAIVKLGSDHLSLYALTVEPHSRFYTRNVPIQDSSDQAEKYLLVCEALSRGGFMQYEISNFSQPSKISQHNMHYWQGGQYIGLGIGAHSYIDGRRFWNIRTLNDYIALMQKGASVEEGFEELTLFDQMKDVVLFGLRMNRGVHLKQAEERFGCCLNEEQETKIKSFIKNGFFVKENGYLKTTTKGRLVLDELCVQLI